MYYFDNKQTKMTRFQFSQLENAIMNWPSDEMYHQASHVLHSGKFDQHFTGEFLADCDKLEELVKAQVA